MTAAQKTAKLKFKQAIAYRKKTGVTLKEAFAHIYGKKVGVVNKKYTVSQLKKIANNAAYATGGDLDKMTYRLLDKDYTDKLLPMYLKAIKEHEEKYNTKLGSTKFKSKKSAPKKKAAKKVSGFRSSIKKIIRTAPQVKKNIKRIIDKKLRNTRIYFGIENKNDLILKRIKEASSDLNTYYNYIDGYKNLSMQDKKNKKVQYKHISNLIKETKTHIKELKKSL